MNYEYRIIKKNYEALKKLGNEGWLLICIDEGNMIFSRNIKQTRKKPVKMEEQDFYNKNLVKGLCPYAFDTDFQELYLEWRQERKFSKSYKTPFNEASEKKIFKKLNKVTKKVAMAMLDKAIEMKWLTLYDLEEKEKEKILMILREDKRKEELSMPEVKKNELQAKIIDEYIENNPIIMKEAREYVEKHNPSITIGKETLINARAKVIANNLIDNLKEGKKY